jgi:hypothetical protein
MSTKEVTNKHTSEASLERIQDAIQTELTKRGIHAPITVEQGRRQGLKYISLSSVPFQTTPVLFKEIRVRDFGGNCFEEGIDGFEYSRFSVTVNVEYILFSGGTNGTTLFTITGTIDGNQVYDVKIY